MTLKKIKNHESDADTLSLIRLNPWDPKKNMVNTKKYVYVVYLFIYFL